MKTDSIPISVGQTTEAVILSPRDAKYLDSNTDGSFNVTLSKSEEFNVFIKGHENESDYIYYYTTKWSQHNQINRGVIFI